MFLALLGFYSILSMITSYLILSYNDYEMLKRFKARRDSARLAKLKPAQLVFLTSIVQYTKE